MSAKTYTLRGNGGAPGIVQGSAVRYHPILEDGANDEQIANEAALVRFGKAQEHVVEKLDQLAAQLREQNKNEEAAIFEAQAALVHDPALQKRVSERLASGRPLKRAIIEATEEMAGVLEALDDAYLCERGADMRAVGQMLLGGLGKTNDWSTLIAGSILLADDLTPAETAELPIDRVAGFATANGGPTGHTAILARALGIPAVIGLGSQLFTIANDTPLILDGDKGLLVVHPGAKDRSAAEQRISAQQAARSRQHGLHDQRGATADGHPVGLWANIGRPEEVQSALDAGAEGIGLFRSEFLFLNRATPPSEDEQFVAYQSVLTLMAGRTVVIRTLDIGGDKPLPYLPMQPEANPFLGTRGLRLSMCHPDLFQTQLRALLRAAPAGDLCVMLPMVATLDDLRWGRAQLQTAAAALAAEQVAHRADVKLGIMIETPAAVAIADLLAQEADFFSIGSNDLAQYTLAVDRGSLDLAMRYHGNEMSVLRLIAQAANAAHHAGIPVGLCGELASDLATAPILVGLGVRELSMTPAMLPAIKERIAAITLADAQEQARTACGLNA